MVFLMKRYFEIDCVWRERDEKTLSIYIYAYVR